jgi:hypothetical protein
MELFNTWMDRPDVNAFEQGADEQSPRSSHGAISISRVPASLAFEQGTLESGK